MKKFLIYTPYFMPTDEKQTNGFLGGSGTQAYREAKYQQKLGKRVSIITVRLNESEKTELYEDITIHRVGFVKDSEVDYGIDETLGLIQKLKPDQVKIFYSKSANTNAILEVLENFKISEVSIRYGSSVDIENINPKVISIINSNENIIVNKSMLNEFVKKFPEAPVRIQPNFSNNKFYQYSSKERLSLRKEFEIPEDTPIFLYTGRLVKEKGIDKLIEIFESISSELNCMILFAGDDYSDRQRGKLGYKDKIKLLEKLMPNRFKYLGMFSYLEMPKIYNLADYFCLPSEREGMSNSLVEAQSSGLVCLVSSIPENRIENVIKVKDFREEILKVVQDFAI
jgi:glycosyltransferase involved in cell wall biosynthesis